MRLRWSQKTRNRLRQSHKRKHRAIDRLLIHQRSLYQVEQQLVAVPRRHQRQRQQKRRLKYLNQRHRCPVKQSQRNRQWQNRRLRQHSKSPQRARNNQHQQNRRQPPRSGQRKQNRQQQHNRSSVSPGSSPVVARKPGRIRRRLLLLKLPTSQRKKASKPGSQRPAGQ